MFFESDSKIAMYKCLSGDDALLVRDGDSYNIFPETVDFEPFLGRDISEKDEDFVLKGTVVDDCFIVSDVLFHGEYLADAPWCERFLELNKSFSFKPSVRKNGAIVVESGEELWNGLKAFEVSPYYEGVYLEGYESSFFDERVFVGEDIVKEVDFDG